MKELWDITKVCWLPIVLMAACLVFLQWSCNYHIKQLGDTPEGQSLERRAKHWFDQNLPDPKENRN